MPAIRFLMVSSFLLALFLAATSDTVRAQSTTAEDCTQSVETVWLGSYSVRAATEGECGLGEITLTVSNRTGGTEFADAYGPNDLFGFYDIVTFDAMQLALNDWITSYAREGHSGELPPWPHGAGGPQAGEFPFYVEEGVGQALYEAVRAEKRPMVCFIQGTESQLCLLQNPDNGALEAVGAQSFPG